MSDDASTPRSMSLGPLKRARAMVETYGHLLWWLHSVYALGLGIGVILFTQNGFRHARWLTVSLGLAWIAMIAFFRLFGSGRSQCSDGQKLRFFVLTALLKNSYQGMLFFLLPFYWRATVIGSNTQWFAVLLAICALLSTLDVIFDHVLMKWKLTASVFYLITLFGCLNLIIPASFPNTRSLLTLVAAAGISSIAFWAIQIPLRWHGRPIVVIGFILWVAASLWGAYVGRVYIPPAAMHVASGGVGPTLLPDGRLMIEARALHESLLTDGLYAVTDVVIPGGKGDRLIHIWRHNNEVIHRSQQEQVNAQPHGQIGTIRLRSKLDEALVPAERTGRWMVDVETSDGQLVGRVEFIVNGARSP